jgi:biopolymer transport protein ExbD/biopolymer transport protein TolR
MAFNASNGRGPASSLAEINVTPFVDVLLVLLIILMVTVPVIESGIDVNVPQTRTVQNNTEERTTVTIKRNGTLYVGSEGINIHELGDKLHALMRDPARQEVYLRADKDVSWGTVATVIDTLRSNHIDKIDVVTKPYEKGQE